MDFAQNYGWVGVNISKLKVKFHIYMFILHFGTNKKHWNLPETPMNGFLLFLWIDFDFDFQSSSAPEFSFCVCPVFVIPRYIAAITITPTTNTNTHKTIVYFDTDNLDDNDDDKTTAPAFEHFES